MVLGISLVGILLYVAFRFEIGYGVGAVVSTIHDVLMTIGIFVLTDGSSTPDGRGDPADRRLFDQRHHRRVRPHPRGVEAQPEHRSSLRDVINLALNLTCSRARSSPAARRSSRRSR
jgi:hypothetical protein